MSNFEDKFGMEIKSREIEEGYEKALKIIEKFLIHIEDFKGKGFYKDSDIESDIDYVKRYEKKDEECPEKEKLQKKLATILEVIFCYKASIWYGKDVLIKKSSAVDDMRYKIDLIMEFLDKSSDNILALGIDCTFGQSCKSQIEKFKNIKDEIEKGELAEIKYFDPKEGGRQKIPHVIVGTTEDNLLEMNGLFLENEKELDSNSTSAEFLLQILLQLYAFREYAGKREKELNKIYTNSFNMVKQEFFKIKERLDKRKVDKYFGVILGNLNEAGFFFDLDSFYGELLDNKKAA